MKPTRYERTEIMLDRTQHRRLTRIARLENCSLSELIREMLDAQLAERELREVNEKAQDLMPDDK
jgi:hypothetical protein